MVRKPRVPMRPGEVPQQRLTLVVDLPPRPPGFVGECDYVTPMAEDLRPRGSPRKTRYVGTVEWASSFANSRSAAYYLNPRRTHWLLWTHWQDDNDGKLRWRWTLYAYAPGREVDERTAAVYLLLDAWRSEAESRHLEHYFLVDEPGLLSVDDFAQIGRSVWPEDDG